jgi:hypothetical protein
MISFRGTSEDISQSFSVSAALRSLQGATDRESYRYEHTGEMFPRRIGDVSWSRKREGSPSPLEQLYS